MTAGELCQLLISRRNLLRGVAAGAGFAALGRTAPAFAGETTRDFFRPDPARPLAAPGRIWPDGIPLGDSGVVDLSSPALVEAPGVGKLFAVGTTRRGASGPTPDRKGRVVLLRPDGTIFQQLDTAGRAVQSSVATGKLFGDSNIPYLVFGVGADVAEENPQTHAFSYAGSVQCWRFNTTTQRFELFWEFAPRDDFPDSVGDGFPDPVISTTCLADVNGDGDLEVFFGSWDRRFYLLNASGIKLWEYNNKDTVWSSAAAGDLDGDGFPEIVCGGDIAANPNENPPILQNGGTLTCFDRFGKVLWRNLYDQVIFSSPAIGDVDGDGNLEVIVGTGDFYKGPNGAMPGNYVLCLNGKTGQEKWRFTTNGFGWASPALGNVLGKTNPATGLPTLQIAITTVIYADPLVNDSRVYLIDSNGAQVWSTRPNTGLPDPRNNYMKGSPIIVDYDGDGKLEVLVANFWSIIAFNSAGTQVATMSTDSSVFGTPLVTDGDGDGKLELYIAGSSQNDTPAHGRGWFYGFNLDAPASAAQPWPMFRRDSARTGLFPPSKLDKNVLAPLGGGLTTFKLQLSSPDSPGTDFTYNVSYTEKFGAPQLFSGEFRAAEITETPAYISISKETDSLDNQAKDALSVTVDGNMMGQLGVTSATLSIGITPTRSQATIVPQLIVLVVSLVKSRVLFFPQPMPIRSPMNW